MISRAIYLTVCGLVFGGIVHIAIILLIPFVGTKDAAKQIFSSGQELRFEPLGAQNIIKIADTDPYFKTSVCRFDLETNGVEIEGPEIPEFWSASVFDSRGRVVYSMNNRTAIKNMLKMVVVNPVQMADIRQLQPEEIETSILVETSSEKGFVILRALVRNKSYDELASGFLNNSICKPYITR